jgi:hypothetical protein
VFAVMLRVMAAGLGVVLFGVAGMPVGAMGVVRLVVPGGLAVMLRRVLVVFGRLVMMVLDAHVVSHISLPVQCEKSAEPTQVA